MKYRISITFRKSLKKLSKKNLILQSQVSEKMRQIVSYPEHFKPLRNDLKGFRRAHVGSFVIIFAVKCEIVTFVRLNHHDKAY